MSNLLAGVNFAGLLTITQNDGAIYKAFVQFTFAEPIIFKEQLLKTVIFRTLN